MILNGINVIELTQFNDGLHKKIRKKGGDKNYSQISVLTTWNTVMMFIGTDTQEEKQKGELENSHFLIYKATVIKTVWY